MFLSLSLSLMYVYVYRYVCTYNCSFIHSSIINYLSSHYSIPDLLLIKSLDALENKTENLALMKHLFMQKEVENK